MSRRWPVAGFAPAATLLAMLAPVPHGARLQADQNPSAPPPPVTFAKNVAPIIVNRCATCHRPGGTAPFSLSTYSDVKARARLIATVTKNRYMPPWKAEPGYGGEFIGQHPLSETEIDVLQRWADQGAIEGNPRDLPSPLRWTDGWQLGKPDLIVTLTQPYTLQADGTDVFRIFTVPLPVGAVRYVRGMEFRPGNPKVVHHANIRIDRTPVSRRLDEDDPAPGYDGLIARSAVYPDGHFLGWTPGQVPPLLPKGLAWRLGPGTDLVVQLHMQPSGKPEAVQPSIGFFFGDDPPERTPAMLRLGRQTIDIPAGERSYIVTDSYVLPVDVDVQAVQPHAHYRAREIRGTATLPDGTTKWLIYIKDWDFRWQHVYRYVAPFVLPKGTTLAMQYTYDNSADNPRNPEHPPRRALWGQRSADEMGDLWIQLLARDDRDLATLVRGFRPKVVAEDIAGYEMMLRENPLDAARHDDVALLYLDLGRTAEAVTHFDASAKLKPESAASHFNLGTALTLAGRLTEAIGEYERALRITPDYAVAHNNLGDVFASQGKLDAAMDQYRESLRSDPTNAMTHNNLGNALLRRGNVSEALRHLSEALRINPAYADAHYNMGRMFQDDGEIREAIGHFQRAVQLEPDWAPALSALAWLLAVAPDASLRDAAEAGRLAERAADLTGRRDAAALDVLAAAYAASGLFDRAIQTAEAALRLTPSASLAREIQSRGELYKRRQPYVMTKQP